jgi:high-affinity iron transporter
VSRIVLVSSVVAGAVVATLALADPAPSPPPPPTPPPPSKELLASGWAVYAKTCLACHGETGEGNGPVAFSLKPPPRNFKVDPFKAGDELAQVFNTVTNGLPHTAMTGYSQVAEADRWALAYTVRIFRFGRRTATGN